MISQKRIRERITLHRDQQLARMICDGSAHLHAGNDRITRRSRSLARKGAHTRKGANIIKLVKSYVQGAVERDRAVQLLTERAILTCLVCRELLDADTAAPDRRLRSAPLLLLRWVGDNQQEFVRTEAQAYDGLKHIVAPEGCEDLVREIEAGAKVCTALLCF